MKQIKIKLGDLLNAVPGLKKLAEREVKPAASYAFSKLLKKLADEITAFEKTRFDLYKRHGVEKDGQYVLETQAAKDTVAAELQELLLVEVDVEFRPIKLSAFIGGVTPVEMMVADQFIEDDLS